MSRHGEFNWNEIQTYNAEKAIQFYQNTIGWEFLAEKMPLGGTYWIGLSAGKPVCGMLELTQQDGSLFFDKWVTYVHVDDIDSATNLVELSGGQILKAPWVVPGVGRVAWIQDPTGAEIGFVTPVNQTD